MKATATTFSAILLLSVAISVVSTTADGAYGVAPATKPELPYKVKEKEIPKPVAVQGLIYCKSGSKLIPLKGITQITISQLNTDNFYCKFLKERKKGQNIYLLQVQD